MRSAPLRYKPESLLVTLWSSHEHNGRRLTAFEIPVAALTHAKANLGRALQLVIDRTISEIGRLRSQTADSHRAGRRHAYLAMLHLNATLAQRIYPSRT